LVIQKQLEDTLVGLKSKHQDELKNVQDITKRCEKYEKKLKELQSLRCVDKLVMSCLIMQIFLRDCIKTYKLLTGTHFVYKTDSTAGCILCQFNRFFKTISIIFLSITI
jgi:hypothetical protein